MRDQLRYKVLAIEDFVAVVDELGKLRNLAAVKLPKGKGMETVKEIYNACR